MKLEDTPDRLDKIETRLTELETSEHRRQGASGVLQAMLRSPTLGWIVGAGTAAWAFMTGKLEL